MFYYEKREEINRDWFVVEEEVDFSYPLHLHRWYEIVLLLEGELDIVIDGVTYNMKQYDSLFIFPDQTHEYISTKPCRHKLCLFKPELIAYFNSKIQSCIPVNPLKNMSGSPWVELFRTMKNTDSVESIKGIMYYYTGMFTADEFTPVSEIDAPDRLDLMHRIFRFADEHFAENCTLTDLAAHIGYDYSYISKLFSEKINMSFTEYVNMLRIDRACYLLKSTELPVLDISEQCGYGSLRSFNRNFLRRMNMTPRDYRRSSVKYNSGVVL